MSKNLKIALGVIVVLLGFIVLNNIDFSSDIPKVKEIKGDIDAIEIEHSGKKISIVKKDKKWLIGKEMYPADTSTVERMIKKMQKIKITDLISKNAFYQTYDLTPEKGVSVKIMEKGQVKRQLLLGKKATAGQQTYVRYDNKKPVFLMTGATVHDFKRTVNALRDKKIFTVSKNAISEFSVNYKGRYFTFYQKEVEDKKPAKKKKGLKIPQKTKKKKIWLCRQYGNVKLSKARMNSLISNFSPLKAASFTDDKKKSLSRATAVITLKAFSKEISLNIYDMDDKKQYRATSSESPYVFTLSRWRAQKFFFENIEKLKE
jgi:hypothetical protein